MIIRQNLTEQTTHIRYIYLNTILVIDLGNLRLYEIVDKNHFKPRILDLYLHLKTKKFLS